MRFKLFNIREDEKPYAYQWGQNNGHEIECTEEDLTLDNVHTLSSFDGVSTQQLFKFDDRIYEALKDVGIKQIAGRAAGFDMFNLTEAAKHDLKITKMCIRDRCYTDLEKTTIFHLNLVNLYIALLSQNKTNSIQASVLVFLLND